MENTSAGEHVARLNVALDRSQSPQTEVSQSTPPLHVHMHIRTNTYVYIDRHTHAHTETFKNSSARGRCALKDSRRDITSAGEHATPGLMSLWAAAAGLRRGKRNRVPACVDNHRNMHLGLEGRVCVCVCVGGVEEFGVAQPN